MRLHSKVSDSPAATQATLPVVCIVTKDKEFLYVLIPEIAPWFKVIVRDSYDDLARSTREADAAYGRSARHRHRRERTLRGLAGSERTAQAEIENSTLISMSRGRARSVEKQALDAGADAHFRNPARYCRKAPHRDGCGNDCAMSRLKEPESAIGCASNRWSRAGSRILWAPVSRCAAGLMTQSNRLLRAASTCSSGARAEPARNGCSRHCCA